MKASIGGFSFYQLLSEGEMDIFGYLETVKFRYRLDAVDLWNGFFCDRNVPIWTLADEDYLRKIRKALDEKQLTVANLAVDRAHLWDPDPEVREQLHQNALLHLRAADILGAKSVRIDTSRGPGAMTEERFDYTVGRFREYAQIASDYGFTVGPENHTGASLNPYWMKLIAEEIDHPGYGILLHIGRWEDGNQQGDLMVAPWVNHTHFDARTVGSAKAEETVKLLNNLGYTGYWAVEYNAPQNPYTELGWALGSMKRVLVSAGLTS
ncbi:sugar phosphate isomerase/epimerase family protein [Paenibacillus sp. FSL H8-0034]|uniref:sugar phosphate isomerase/epimerase family protein n=1 Tax=Paenibacillus sp. FSL H8-0034 TaxID=2954671 RepID=UPI0030F4E736